MNILITGGSGKIGKHLIPVLQKSGHFCYILSRKNEENEFFRQGDLLNIDSLIKSLDNIDAVIHLAAKTHANNASEYFLINLEGTKNLIYACEQTKIKKFLYISSYTASPDGGAYADSKYQTEEIIKKTDLNWIILKLSEVYGAGQGEAIDLLQKNVKNHKIIFYPKHKDIFLQPVSVNDVCFAINAALSSGLDMKTYLIAGPKRLNYHDLLLKIAEEHRKKIFLFPIPIFLIRITTFLLAPFGLSPIKKDQLDRLLVQKPFDISSAENDLNFHPKIF